MAKDAFDYLEDRRLKGIAVTGKELSSKFSSGEVKTGLTKQRKKITPEKEDDILDSQSKMRKMFSKNYK